MIEHCEQRNENPASALGEVLNLFGEFLDLLGLFHDR
jgi:hypothetical protein